MAVKYRIAVIEDDPLLQEAIKFALEAAKFLVDAYFNIETFFNHYNQGSRYDLIILDIILPTQPGTSILASWRKRGETTPILIISVKKDIATKVAHLNLGADDFLVKPFDLEELLARVNALLRRSLGQRHLPASSKIKINGYEVDFERRTCQSNLGLTTLSEKETKLLQFFVTHPDETHSRADLLEETWGMGVSPTPRTVDNFILKFRKLFETDPKRPKIFISVRGVGYRFHHQS